MPLQPQRDPNPADLLDLNPVDADLQIEHDGHKLTLTGSNSFFVVRFPTLAALFHFGGLFWPSRKRVPRQLSLDVEWRAFRLSVKKARAGLHR